eukprot:3806517-Pleurochrysis_carterae.AAC.1
MRNSVGEEWKPRVLLRVDDTKFAVYAADGCTGLGTTIVDGNNENGVRFDDSLEEEWDLTIKSVSTQELHAEHGLEEGNEQNVQINNGPTASNLAKDLIDLAAAAGVALQDDLALPPSPAPTLASGMPAAAHDATLHQQSVVRNC